MVSVEGSWNWITSSGNTGSTYGLLTETHHRTVEAFRIANCHCTNRLSEGGGTVILVRRGIGHYAVPAQDLKHLEDTAIQVMLASKPVTILAL
jgi:hypothetical protein